MVMVMAMMMIAYRNDLYTPVIFDGNICVAGKRSLSPFAA
jgi:hypothetical protein